MNVRTLCLAILYFEEATGYEIRKMSSEGKYSHFVDASYGSIYPALTKLEADGLVTVRTVSEEGKPSRKIYSITDEGRAVFIEGLEEEPAPDVFRSEFLLIAMCADILPPEVVQRAVEKRMAYLEHEIEHLQGLCGSKGCGFKHKGTEWVKRYGLACVRASRDHLLKTKHELEEISGTASPVKDAAE